MLIYGSNGLGWHKILCGDVFYHCNHSWVLISFSLVLHTQPLTYNHWKPSTIDYPYHWHGTHALNHCLHSTTGHTNLHLHSTTDMQPMKTHNQWHTTIDLQPLNQTQPLTTHITDMQPMHSTIVYIQPLVTSTFVYTQPLTRNQYKHATIETSTINMQPFNQTLSHWLHTTIGYT